MRFGLLKFASGPRANVSFYNPICMRNCSWNGFPPQVGGHTPLRGSQGDSACLTAKVPPHQVCRQASSDLVFILSADWALFGASVDGGNVRIVSIVVFDSKCAVASGWKVGLFGCPWLSVRLKFCFCCLVWMESPAGSCSSALDGREGVGLWANYCTTSSLGRRRSGCVWSLW